MGEFWQMVGNNGDVVWCFFVSFFFFAFHYTCHIFMHATTFNMFVCRLAIPVQSGQGVCPQSYLATVHEKKMLNFMTQKLLLDSSRSCSEPL